MDLVLVQAWPVVWLEAVSVSFGVKRAVVSVRLVLAPALVVAEGVGEAEYRFVAPAVWQCR